MITTPSGKEIRLYEIKNRDYTILNKFCNNSDFEGFIGILSNLIEDYDELDVIDKAYALIAFRMIFIDPDLGILNEEGIAVTFPVANILEVLDSLPRLHGIYDECEDFMIKLGKPMHFDHQSRDIYDVLTELTLGEKTLTGVDCQEVFDFLPAGVFSFINKKLLHQFEKVANIVLIEDNPNVKLKGLTVNLTNGSFIPFIMTMYKTSMDNMFESMYIFTQHFGSVDYFDMSPLDSRVLEGILRREIAKSQEQNKEQSPMMIGNGPIAPPL